METKYAYRSRFQLWMYLIILLTAIAMTAWLAIIVCSEPQRNNIVIIIWLLVVAMAYIIIGLWMVIRSAIQKKVAVQYDYSVIIINYRKPVTISWDDVTDCRYRLGVNNKFTSSFGKLYIYTYSKTYIVDAIKDVVIVASNMYDVLQQHKEKVRAIDDIVHLTNKCT